MKYTPEQITELLEEVRTAREAATPGPWEFRRKKWTPGDGEWGEKEFSVGDLRHEVKKNSYHTILDPQKNEYGQYDLYAWNESDARIIANAPTWLQKLTEIVQQQEQQLSKAWKAYDNLKAEMEALGDQSSVLKESLSAVVDELKSTKIKLEEEQRVALHHERERCRVSTKLATAVETLKEISQGERSSIALAHMAADALVRIKTSQVDVLNSLEVIDQEGGDHAYILVEDNEENRQKLRAVGVTDEQITEARDDGESFCLLALALNNDLADTYEKGKFVIWGPIDDELRHRVLEGKGTSEDACRLLKALEPDLFGMNRGEL